jgi:hypothetical protein
MYYSHVEIEYVATSFSPARMDLAFKLLKETLAKYSQPWHTLVCTMISQRVYPSTLAVILATTTTPVFHLMSTSM